MMVSEARSLFRDYVDDPDGTFLTDAQVNQYLNFGLDDWLKFVRQHRPDILLKFINLTSANAANYAVQPAAAKPAAYALDLNNVNIVYPGKAANTPLMGPYVDTSGGAGAYVTNHGPIATISNLYRVSTGPDADQTRRWRLTPVSRGEMLSLSGNSFNYMLQHYTLFFAGQFPEQLAIEYFPRRNTDFNTSDVSSPIEGGVMDQFHELVVLLGTRRYFIRDGQPNQLIEQQTAINTRDFTRYLQDGQLQSAFDNVTVTHLF